MDDKKTYRCKRCNKAASADMICQSCKNELLANYEVSCDWQTAYEIEKAQLTASRYQLEDNDDPEFYLY